ncbi:MIKC-type MADS-box transcription factor WM4 [Hordeum vulgare]|nr:MIKC-type MADS-box transcription factor WM4 [Hordeum vulgare]
MKELEQIENQIDISLKNIRTRKHKVLLDELFDLKSKEQELQDQNKDLRKKLQDMSCAKNALHRAWQDGGQSSSNGNAIDTTYPGFAQHPETEHDMQLGYNNQAYMDQPNNNEGMASQRLDGLGSSAGRCSCSLELVAEGGNPGMTTTASTGSKPRARRPPRRLELAGRPAAKSSSAPSLQSGKQRDHAASRGRIPPPGELPCSLGSASAT